MPVAEYSNSIARVNSTIHNENNNASRERNSYRLTALNKDLKNKIPLRIIEDASIPTTLEKLSANIIQNEKYVFLIS